MPVSSGHLQHVSDDEALARLLQREEQIRSANRHHATEKLRLTEQVRKDQELAQHFANHQHSSEQLRLTEQERKDQKLAEQFARMDMHGTGSAAIKFEEAHNMPPNNHLTPQRLPQPTLNENRNHRQAPLSMQISAMISSSDLNENEMGTAEGRLEFARRAQLQAFSDLRNSTATKASQSIQSDRDLALAIQIQESERQDRHQYVMESNGRNSTSSVRDQDINAIISDSTAAGNQPSHNHETIVERDNALFPVSSTNERPRGLAKMPGNIWRLDDSEGGVFLDPPASEPNKEKKKRNRGFLGFGGGWKNSSKPDPGDKKSAQNDSLIVNDKKPPANTAPNIPALPAVPPMSHGIPSAIPPPPGGSISLPPARNFQGINRPGMLPHSISVSRNISQSVCHTSNFLNSPPQGLFACSVCKLAGGSLFAALDKKYHRECFRCATCNDLIDPNCTFAFTTDSRGEKQPHHRQCFAQMDAIVCAVCKAPIPANHEGMVSFVKHPFFDKDLMCPRHADDSAVRRCTGCHRFEPDGEPFADLNDSGRCVCFACCRTVIVDNLDAKPLWTMVLSFFEKKLKLPIWPGMVEIPILVVGYDTLNKEMRRGRSIHGGSSQIMARGLCLSAQDECKKFKLPSLHFNESSKSFESSSKSSDADFTYFELPGVADKYKISAANIVAILCLSGLPRDLTASILAHEATHAWIKLHPQYNLHKTVPPQVEEGVAQLIAMLFLCSGLESTAVAAIPEDNASGPSDEKLRQYFKFCIETDDSEIYGQGYRRAAKVYRDIGIEALMDYVVRYRKFPET